MTEPTLTADDLDAIDAVLGDDDAVRRELYPGDPTTRQPVHTVYVPADQVDADVARDWGERALAALDRDAPDPAAFAAATGVDRGLVASVWDQVRSKLADEPIEDIRVDLEDGYGARPEEEEDDHARRAGAAIASAAERAMLPPYCGVRVKSLESSTRARGIRSLDLIVGAIVEGGDLPPGWVQTMPKVTSVRQVSAMVELCSRLERRHGLHDGSLRFEIQIETPQSILAADGTATVARLIQAAEGRCTGLHFGTYDYTAAIGIAGGHQALDHPAADHAKSVLQVAAAGTGVRVSDGSTNIVPVGDRVSVHSAWATHARLVRRALERGIYQGWDLHPAQLPTRYLATYLFFRRDLDVVLQRLSSYLAAGSSPGGASGSVMDEPATAQALAAFVLRGVNCGAVRGDEVTTGAGCDVATLATLANRRVG